LVLDHDQDPNTTTGSSTTTTMDQIVEWMHRHLETVLEQQQQQQLEILHWIQFTLCLYAARIALAKKKSTTATTATSTNNNKKQQNSGATTASTTIDHFHGKVARKELKQALEIFSTKLLKTNSSTSSGTTMSAAVATTETASVRSESSVPPPMIMSITSTSTSTTLASAHEHSKTSPLLSHLYQAALNLKAHTEQLKGNVKKSLILCQEVKSSSPAITTTTNTTTATTNGTNSLHLTTMTMIHENNLAHVYATSGKRYLACHAWSKVVEMGNEECSISNKNKDDITGRISTDGTIVIPLEYTQANILWNASLAHLMLPEGNNYVTAYRGLATILASSGDSSMREGPGECITGMPPGTSPTTPSKVIPWAQQGKRRARLWLRLGEACLGMYVQLQKQQHSTKSKNVQGIQVGGYVDYTHYHWV
jgi:hypothetical protein